MHQVLSNEFTAEWQAHLADHQYGNFFHSAVMSAARKYERSIGAMFEGGGYKLLIVAGPLSAQHHFVST